MSAIFASITELGFDPPQPPFSLGRQGHQGLNAVRSRYGFHQSDRFPVMDQAVGKLQARGFQTLCQKLRPDLLRFAYWLCHDHALAEDVVQESMLRAWKAQGSLRKREPRVRTLTVEGISALSKRVVSRYATAASP